MIVQLIRFLVQTSILIAPFSFAADKIPTCRAMKEGICFNAAPSVEQAAIERAQYIVKQMLKNSPEISKKMVDSAFVVEIIGRNQVLSDLPRYKALKNQKTFDGRGYDSGTRGVGDEKACSIGEENLLCTKGQMYYEENILVHEFAHSVLYFMSRQLRDQVSQAFVKAKKSKLYPKEIYMMSDHHEYWATATQAWFNAIVRVDVNAGINTRAKILKHDPELAKILQVVYGLTEIVPVKSCLY